MDFILELGETIWSSLIQWIPSVLLALVVLLAGWVVSKAIAGLVGRLVRRATRSERVKDLMEPGDEEGFAIDQGVSLGVFYLLMIVTLVFVFDILGVVLITGPLLAMVREFSLAVPSLIKALLILLAAWVVATVVRGLLGRILSLDSLAKLFIRLGVAEDEEAVARMTRGAGNLAFYLILLLFVPAILAALDLQGLVSPVEGLVAQALAFLPRLAAAAATALIGYLAARVVQTIVTRFLAGIGADGLVKRLGMDSVFQKTTLSRAVGTVAFVLILIPAAISALDSLGVEALTRPAVEMLTTVLEMLPVFIGALIFLAAGLVLARWVGDLTASLLEGINLGGFLAKWGLLRDEVTDPPVHRVVGSIVAGLVGFLIVVQVFDILRLEILSDLMREILAYIPNVFVAVLILAVGYVVGGFVGRSLGAVLEKTDYPPLLARVAKYAIFVVAAAMALDQLGVAQSIVATGFTILLGALGLAAAIAAGLSVGLGATDTVQRWLHRRADEHMGGFDGGDD